MLLDSGKYLGKVSDFSEYYTAAWFLSSGKGSQIYDLAIFGAKQLELFPELGTRVVGFYLTPLVVPAFFPLLAISKDVGYLAWVLLLLMCVVVSVFLLARFLRLNFRYGLMLWAFVSVAGPVYESLKLGQIGPVLLLSYVVSIILLDKKRPVLSGVFLAPFLAKPHLLMPLLVLYFAAKKWKLLTAFGLVFLALFVVSLVTVGINGWELYFQLLIDNFLTKQHFTPTLRDQLRMIIPNASIAISLVCILVQALLFWMLFVLGRKFGKSNDFVFLSALIALPIALVFSPYVQIYDWILFVPSIVVCFSKGYINLIDRRLAIVLFVSLFILILPFSAFVHYYYVNKDGLINPSFFVGVLYLCIVLKSAFLSQSNEIESSP